jgi:hypothetical protein
MFRSYERFKLVPHKFDQPALFDFHTGTHLKFPTLQKAKRALRYAQEHLSNQPELRPAHFPDHLQDGQESYSE